ncbi:hypothetical protein CISIN_1g041083mg [Citrus sinensis]|uniref:Dirigent protein n=1 Tax=Citrus sinensis TaxID=2711 RepID=A0A067DD28_CITSI|nr:hypothetical protein CISIN_1g041083mg [Citrus sinensis]
MIKHFIVLLLIICPMVATTIQSERLWLRGLIMQKRQQQKHSGKKHCSSHRYLQATNSFLHCDMADDSLIETTSPQSKRVSRAQGLYGSACQHQLAIIILLGNNRSTVPVRKMPIVGVTRVFLLTGGYAIARTHRAGFKSGDAIIGCNVIVVY